MLEKPLTLQELSELAHWSHGKLPPAVSLQCPLQKMLEIYPAGKAKIFKGPISIFVEQAMKAKFSREASK